MIFALVWVVILVFVLPSGWWNIPLAIILSIPLALITSKILGQLGKSKPGS
jgi:hypothetical protein